MKVIRKYSNRKLYDTETHKYVNLLNIIEMVKVGVSFKVMNHKAHNITNEVLSAAILELMVVNDPKEMIINGILK